MKWPTAFWISSAVLAGGVAIAVFYAVTWGSFSIYSVDKKRKQAAVASASSRQDSREKEPTSASETLSASLDDLDDRKPQLLFKNVLADNSREPFRHLVGEFGPHTPSEGDSDHPFAPLIRQLITQPVSAKHCLPPSCLPPPGPGKDPAAPSRLVTTNGTDRTGSVEPEGGPAAFLCGCTAPEPVWVQEEAQLQQLAALLAGEEEFAVDTEQHSLHSFRGFTALMQISTRDGRSFLLDCLRLHDCLHHLRPVFADPRICKLLHGADGDLLWLQRDFQLYTVNVFDTLRACDALNKQQRSLASLLSAYCHVSTDKTLQRADWRQRPLPPAMMTYAHIDTHYLPYLADRLRWELLHAGREGRGGADSGREEIEDKEEGEGEGEGAEKRNEDSTRLPGSVGLEGPNGASLSGGTEEAEGAGSSTACFLCWSRKQPTASASASASASAPPSAPLREAVRRSLALCLQLFQKDEGPPAEAAAGQLLRQHLGAEGEVLRAGWRAGAAALAAAAAAVSTAAGAGDSGGSGDGDENGGSSMEAVCSEGSGGGRGSSTGPSSAAAPAEQRSASVQNAPEPSRDKQQRPQAAEGAAAAACLPVQQVVRCGGCGSTNPVPAVRAALVAVLTWRDRVARADDESLRFVLPDAAAVAVAVAAPQTEAELVACVKYVTREGRPGCPSPSPSLLRHSASLLLAMQQALRSSTALLPACAAAPFSHLTRNDSIAPSLLHHPGQPPPGASAPHGHATDGRAAIEEGGSLSSLCLLSRRHALLFLRHSAALRGGRGRPGARAVGSKALSAGGEAGGGRGHGSSAADSGERAWPGLVLEEGRDVSGHEDTQTAEDGWQLPVTAALGDGKGRGPGVPPSLGASAAKPLPKRWRQSGNPSAARDRFIQKFSCKGPVYENCRIYAGDGRLLCFCDRSKLEWYVARGLAEYVAEGEVVGEGGAGKGRDSASNHTGPGAEEEDDGGVEGNGAAMSECLQEGAVPKVRRKLFTLDEHARSGEAGSGGAVGAGPSQWQGFPPSIRLLFEPKGRPEDDDNGFYIQRKRNCCVGCGEAGHFLRYRVVPSCYRHAFPERLKSHRSHDIVLLCVDCHEVAHAAAERHKRAVARRYGIPLQPPPVGLWTAQAPLQHNRHEERQEANRPTADECPAGVPSKAGVSVVAAPGAPQFVEATAVRRAIVTVLRHGPSLPPERLRELLQPIRLVLGLQGQGQERGASHSAEAAESGAARAEAPAPAAAEPPAPAGVAKPCLPAAAPSRRALTVADIERAAELVGPPGRSRVPSRRVKRLSEEGRRQLGEALAAEGRGSGNWEQQEGAAEGAVAAAAAVTATGREAARGMEIGESFDEADGETADAGEASGAGLVGAQPPNSGDAGAVGEAAREARLPGSAAVRVQRSGHWEHGRQVVAVLRRQGEEERRRCEALGKEGGEGRGGSLGRDPEGEDGSEDAVLKAFIQEWREVFVGAVQPQFLPSGWDVRHSGRREFGEYSVYSKEHRC